MLYHPDGRTIVVDTPQHQGELALDGWVTAPLAVHRQRPVTHHGLLGADTLFAWPLRGW